MSASVPFRKAQRNFKVSHFFSLQQSGEICRRWVLAQGTEADRRLLPAVLGLRRAAYGRVGGGANGHGRQ